MKNKWTTSLLFRSGCHWYSAPTLGKMRSGRECVGERWTGWPTAGNRFAWFLVKFNSLRLLLLLHFGMRATLRVHFFSKERKKENVTLPPHCCCCCVSCCCHFQLVIWKGKNQEARQRFSLFSLYSSGLSRQRTRRTFYSCAFPVVDGQQMNRFTQRDTFTCLCGGTVQW